MTRPLAWILNLDADLELMDPDGDAASHRRRVQTEELGRSFLAAARATLPMFEHLPVDAAAASPGALCQSWCPTSRAVTLAREHGLSLPTPGMDVLRRVNHKAFSAALAGTRYAWSLAALARSLAEVGRPALLKRPFGFSGRGQKRLDGPLAGAAHTWAAASMQQYGRGLQVEPWRHIVAEFALHGWLGPDGTVLRGQPTRMHCDPSGRWLRTEITGELSEREAEALTTALEATAKALVTAGYRGPFSIDGFRFREGDGSGFTASSEINARYTMGFFTGMATEADALAGRILAAGRDATRHLRPSSPSRSNV